MNWKQFFDWRKIVLTIILMSFLIWIWWLGINPGYVINFVDIIGWSFFISYLLSYTIVWIYDNFRKKKVKKV